MKKKILIAVLLFLVLIQFFRAEENHGPVQTNQDYTHYLNVPVQVGQTLQTSCYDCHSNNTTYPWYAQVNPVGWWLNHHIAEGKAELNFSDFSGYDRKKIDHKLEEIAEQIQEGHMPLPAYLWLHTDARLSQQQVQQVVAWVKEERQRLSVTK